MTVQRVEFVTADGTVLGVVEFSGNTYEAVPPVLGDVVRPVWVRFGKDPAKTAAFFKSWSNGHLQGRPVEGNTKRERGT